MTLIGHDPSERLDELLSYSLFLIGIRILLSPRENTEMSRSNAHANLYYPGI